MGLVQVFCGCPGKKDEDPYLISVGDTGMSMAQFKEAVDMAIEEAYPDETNIEATVRDDIRMRVLKQLTEELMIVEKAKSLGIKVSENEIKKAVEGIKADYPDNTFEETLLENAISFKRWKQRLIRRLLLDKVIQQELVDKADISSQDIAAYYKTYFPEGPPENENADEFNQKVVHHLRQQKAEDAYKEWITSLRTMFPVKIDQEQWDQLIKSP
jgi:FKBP-type peptidyl-prolyl cis-trans isomerase (trigger factor)